MSKSQGPGPVMRLKPTRDKGYYESKHTWSLWETAKHVSVVSKVTKSKDFQPKRYFIGSLWINWYPSSLSMVVLNSEAFTLRNRQILTANYSLDRGIKKYFFVLLDDRCTLIRFESDWKGYTKLYPINGSELNWTLYLTLRVWIPDRRFENIG